MSLFQPYPVTHPRMGLSFGIEREVLARINDAPEISDTLLKDIVVEAYSIIHPLEIVQELAELLVARVLERINDLQEKEKAQASSSVKRRTFGSSYAEWLSGLDATQACMYAADFDLAKALHYYWAEDYLLVNEIVKTKSEHESQMALTRMEAAMYGSGNSYKDDNGADPNTVVLDELGAEDIKSAMAGFGF
jgi:hypothetical protein